MHALILDAGLENWHDFEIRSRNEIVALLRAIGAQHKLIRILIRGESEVCLSAILEVDAGNGSVVLDGSIDNEQNRRIVNAGSVSFETALDKIRILFTCEHVEECVHQNRPAFKIAVPPSMIRLQRREHYRMTTPVGNPVRVIIALPAELGGGNCAFPLADISCGGVAILDKELILGDGIGNKYGACRIELPMEGTVTTSLQIRNVVALTLLNNKSNRRLGCQFINIERPMLTRVQRYITKLERERNARLNGLG